MAGGPVRPSCRPSCRAPAALDMSRSTRRVETGEEPARDAGGKEASKGQRQSDPGGRRRVPGDGDPRPRGARLALPFSGFSLCSQFPPLFICNCTPSAPPPVSGQWSGSLLRKDQCCQDKKEKRREAESSSTDQRREVIAA